MNFLWTSMLSLFVPGTHLCLRRWWKADPRCRRLWEKKWCRVPLKGRLANLSKYNMVLTSLKRHSCSLAVTCFVVIRAHSLEKVPLFLSQAFTLSVLQFVTEEMLMMSHCWGYQCHLHSILSSSGLNLCLLLSSRFIFSYGRAIVFIIKKKVSLLLFWHLHAVKDRQKPHRLWQLLRHKMCFDGVSCRHQNVWWTLYIKALEI